MKKNTNTFMIALVAVTIIAVGVLVWLGYSKNTAITEELMAQRESINGKIRNLSRKPYVNQSTNLANEKQVEMLLDNLSQVCNLNYTFNSRNFSVPVLEGIIGGPRPALPYDKKVWGDKELADKYVVAYRKNMAKLLTTLNPTTIPSEVDITNAVKVQTEILENKARVESKVNETGGAAVPGGMPAAPAYVPGGMAGAPGANVPQDITAKAQTIALNDQVLAKSKEGYIYADSTSLFPMFIDGKIYSAADLPAEDVWLAQKSAWIQTDIVNAINETIKDVLGARKLPQPDRNVTNSPIKRLVSINIEKAKSAGTGTNRDMMMGGPGGPGYPGGGGYGGGGYGGYGDMNEVNKADTLTRYTANTLFDVADYNFTVIMPTRYIPILEKKLLAQNYHVILNVEIIPADSISEASAVGGIGGTPFGMGGSTNRTSADMYNYGTEPVSRVTINAQLLLMTSFTRGQWDAKTNKWTSYPLMPSEVLKTLPQAALRQDDKDFLDQLGRLERGEQPFEGRPTVPWFRNDSWRPENPAAADVKAPEKVQ